MHVTMALASLPGKLDHYLSIPGLTALELDVKDENGEVGFLMPATSLARKVGASKPYYKAGVVAGKARAKGVYLIGRVVVFEDPMLTASGRTSRSGRAAAASGRTTPASAGRTRTTSGSGTTCSRSRKAAARAGFDEIQFDYVRFPSDGPIESAVFPGKTAEPPGWTIARFVHYASKQLKPLGVRVSVDLFGLSATHELGVGQKPGRLAKYVDAVYPMVYPSHYNPGEFNLPDPSSAPGKHGLALAPRLPQRDARPQGHAHPVARGLLAHERPPAARGGPGPDRRGPPEQREGLPALEPERRLHGRTPQVGSWREPTPEG